MIRLSFIVPFYNVEPYIEECIRSLYNQDIPMEEYEVICVDDCSPDGSRAIVERLQKEYPTLRLLVHTENKRQGGARNTGLREAKGRYVWFVDGDDTILLNCIGKMLKKAEKADLDLLKFYFGPCNTEQLQCLPHSQEVTTGTQLIFDIQTDAPLITRCCSAVQQLIKREFLITNDIRFAEHVQYEDDDYAYQLYAYAARTYLIAEAPYIVRKTPNSTTRRQNDSRRIRDIYAQALRMVKIEPMLSQCDARWNKMIGLNLRDSFEAQIFRFIKDCTLKEQISFWHTMRKERHLFQPYLGRKSYLKLSSYIAWKILQK